MAGHRNFKELRDELAATVGEDRLAEGEREEIARYDDETQRLAEVRRARALTQTQLAKALGVSQAQVSRIEKQSDLYLSTLASYIEAMGGELQLVAAFGDKRVHLDLDAPEPVLATPPEPQAPATVPDLMVALEASLAAKRVDALSGASGALVIHNVATELGVTDEVIRLAMQHGIESLPLVGLTERYGGEPGTPNARHEGRALDTADE